MNLLSDEGLVKLGFSKRIIKSCNLLKKWHKKNQLIPFKSFNEIWEKKQTKISKNCQKFSKKKF